MTSQNPGILRVSIILRVKLILSCHYDITEGIRLNTKILLFTTIWQACPALFNLIIPGTLLGESGVIMTSQTPGILRVSITLRVKLILWCHYDITEGIRLNTKILLFTTIWQAFPMLFNLIIPGTLLGERGVLMTSQNPGILRMSITLRVKLILWCHYDITEGIMLNTKILLFTTISQACPTLFNFFLNQIFKHLYSF